MAFAILVGFIFIGFAVNHGLCAIAEVIQNVAYDIRRDKRVV